MPELPEVEVTRRSFASAIAGARILSAQMGKPLRWPLGLAPVQLVGRQVIGVRRRGKYLLFDCQSTQGGGWLIVHLGMSGSLRLVAPGTAHQKHDHVDLTFAKPCLRLRDPRRFGTLLWHEGQGIESHPLLARLGIELRTGSLVTGVGPRGVTLLCGDAVEQVPARTVLWAAGVEGSPLGRLLARAAGAPPVLHSLPGRNDTGRLGLDALLGECPGLGGCIFLPGDQPLR